MRPLQLAHIIPYALSVIAVWRLIQHDICYALRIIVIRHLVHHTVSYSYGTLYLSTIATT